MNDENHPLLVITLFYIRKEIHHGKNSKPLHQSFAPATPVFIPRCLLVSGDFNNIYYREPVMNTAEMHAIEQPCRWFHLRNNSIGR